MRAYNMVEETTTSIASSGAGAVTLTAITGYPRFSTAFGTQNTTVRYMIEDTVNNKWEHGIGHVSSNVLTRTRPQITWDGTTLLDQAPSALTFTGAPTSGNIRIRMAPSPEALGIAMPGRQSVAGSDPWRDYPISWHMGGHFGNGGTYTMVADREYYIPYILTVAGSLSGIQMEVNAQIASSNVKLALYSCGHDGLPAAKIVDFNVVSSASTGIKTDTSSGTWSPAVKPWVPCGWFYIGIIPSHAIGIRYPGGGNAAYQGTPLGRNNGYGFTSGLYVAGSYATGLPATPSLGSSSTMSTNEGFWIGLRSIP